MKIGLFSVADHYPSELPRTSERLYAELLEQVEAADELGFESFWIAEHHFHEYGGIPRPPLWMSAAAVRTKRIRLGAGVVVLPFDNPLRSAEDYAMVDVISAGRLDLGVGSGYLKHEYAGFGVDMTDKRDRFEEALDVLLRAWSGARFSHEGRYHSVKDVQLNVVPLQKPRPPVSVAILTNDRAAVVGSQGFPIMMIPYATTERIAELADTVGAFRRAFLAAGGKPEQATIHFALHTHCAETTADARREAREPLERYVRTRLFAKQRSFDELIDKNLLAIGDPEEVLRVGKLYAAAGMTHFLALNNFGGMDHRLVLGSMERIARHVMPALRDEPREAPRAASSA
ncbi:MAG TPA: LLM class flavin-dependent oxidoreductase [Candidatus Binatia bacterium]|nr:LLM class flavin-dependent oxidoreductase [Candidatus Binatia bacterium]